jgi:hypothetical protein
MHSEGVRPFYGMRRGRLKIRSHSASARLGVQVAIDQPLVGEKLEDAALRNGYEGVEVAEEELTHEDDPGTIGEAGELPYPDGLHFRRSTLEGEGGRPAAFRNEPGEARLVQKAAQVVFGDGIRVLEPQQGIGR